MKHIGFGFVGALFSNLSLKEKFNFYDNESRNSSGTLISYTYYYPKKLNCNRMIKRGDKIDKYQRHIAEVLTFGLIDNPVIDIANDSI